MAYNSDTFRRQIQEDIAHIIENNPYLTGKADDFAFNHWIISKIFNEDDEVIPDLITDPHDDGIDCYVNFENEKLLYIIQNKYYGKDTHVGVDKINTFLAHPLSTLLENKYKRCPELQTIFTKAKADSDYKIFMRFFTTDEARNAEIDDAIKAFNKGPKPSGISCGIYAEYYNLDGIYELYYGRSYNENISFHFDLHTINAHTELYLQNKNEKLDTPYQAYYIVTPISELYKMLKEAKAKNYAIFDQNMREYLGEKTSVNNGIIKTLEDPDDRKFFLYYNNGVTIICQNLKDEGRDVSYSVNNRRLHLTNPQIINGCQTVSSIDFVLNSYPSDLAIDKEFGNVYVIVKALIIPDDKDNKENDKKFYKSVVRYSNKQNAIPDKVFVSNDEYFKTLQDEFEKRGFLLAVKQSDKNSFKSKKKKEQDYLAKANKIISAFPRHAERLNDIIIDLEKLLQVFVAFMDTGYSAFTNKSQLLKKDSTIYKNFSSAITNYLTTDDMIKLYWLYFCAEKDKRGSKDKRTPVPYYVIGFMGTLIGDKTAESIKKAFDKIFYDATTLKDSYDYLCDFTETYCNIYTSTLGEYNNMIKRSIDENTFKICIQTKLAGRKAIENWVAEEYKQKK